MKFKTKILPFVTKGPLMGMINNKDALILNIQAMDRVKIKKGEKETVIALEITFGNKEVKPGELGLFLDVVQELKIKNADKIELLSEQRPKSLEYIKEKLDKKELNKEKIDQIIKDILANKLTEVESTYFVAGSYVNKMTLDESAYLAEAIVNNSSKLTFDKKPVVDKHCLTPDTKLMIEKEEKIKILKIKEVVDQFIPEETSEVIEREVNDLKVPSFDKNNKISFKKIKRVFKIPYNDLIVELNLRGNRKIELTPDHSIFVLREGKIGKIPVNQCKLTDHVVIPNKIQFETKDEIKIIQDLKGITREKQCKELAEVIKFTAEFARLLGYYVAEGFSNDQGIFFNFGSHEKELIEDCEKCIEHVFKIKPTIGAAHKTATRIRIYSKVIKNLFDTWEIGDNAQNKKIPYFVFNFENNLKKEFLKGYIYGDGYRRRGYETIAVTVSEELITDLSYMLSSLGISYSCTEKEEHYTSFPNGQTLLVSKSYYLYTQTKKIFDLEYEKQSNAFNNLLPIKEIKKAINLENLDFETRRIFRRQKYISITKLEKIKEHITDEKILNLIENDIRVLPIKSIRVHYPKIKYVYDLEVEDNHNFFAGNAPIGISNCIGGIPANRTTPIVVSIIAAAGLTIPKTSTRSITSPAGTADCVEVLAPVIHSKEKIMEIVNKTNGCMVWGGAVDLASADDKLIRLEKVLNLDPEGFLLASILAKKASVSSSHVLIDIPIGPEAKIKDKKRAKDLGKKFIKLGKILGMKIKIIITDGSQPIGNGVGPSLEARDVLLVLQNKGPQDLKKKGLYMAAKILKMTGIWNSKRKAREILESGKAYEKLKEIISAQGGNPNIQPEEIKLGKYTLDYPAEKEGKVTYLSNNLISRLAKTLGAPTDKGAGLYLHKKIGDKVTKNEPLFTLYAENKERFEFAQKEDLTKVAKID